MQDAQLTDLTPAIAAKANDLIDAVLAMALQPLLTGDFTTMRDSVDDITDLAPALAELVDIQTQGGRGPASEGFSPADPVAVVRALRAHTLARIEQLATVDIDGIRHLHRA
ncbi:hypothetical protein [Nocardia testacea]|uniref:hypothetical protein n=1 Tax=Nocardia testacea TaxID=248551 RepID=UPI0034084879